MLSNENWLALLAEDVENMPAEIVNALSEKLWKQSVKNQMTVLNSKVQELEIKTIDNTKEIIQIKQREKEKTKAEDCFSEASTIASKIFPGENVHKLMSGQLMGLFYFGLGIYGKCMAPLNDHLAESPKIALEKNRYFYSAEKRVGRNKEIVNYYPGNTEKILILLNEKLAEFAVKEEFYNAPDTEELLWIACYLSAIRLNKLNKDVNKKIDLNLEKRDLIRSVKAELKDLKLTALSND